MLKNPNRTRKSKLWLKNYFYSGVKLERWREPLSPGLTLVEVTSLQQKELNPTGLRALWTPSCRRPWNSCLEIPTLGLGEAAACEVSPRKAGPAQPIPLTSPGVKGGALTSSILSPAELPLFETFIVQVPEKNRLSPGANCKKKIATQAKTVLMSCFQ